jgi:hypothetical protein
MAHLGNRTWIEADPNIHKVLEITLPTNTPLIEPNGRFSHIRLSESGRVLRVAARTFHQGG